MISTVGILSSSSSSCVQLLTLSNPSPHFDTTLEKVFNARQLLGFLSKAKTWPLSKLPGSLMGGAAGVVRWVRHAMYQLAVCLFLLPILPS